MANTTTELKILVDYLDSYHEMLATTKVTKQYLLQVASDLNVKPKSGKLQSMTMQQLKNAINDKDTYYRGALIQAEEKSVSRSPVQKSRSPIRKSRSPIRVKSAGVSKSPTKAKTLKYNVSFKSPRRTVVRAALEDHHLPKNEVCMETTYNLTKKVLGMRRNWKQGWLSPSEYRGYGWVPGLRG